MSTTCTTTIEPTEAEIAQIQAMEQGKKIGTLTFLQGTDDEGIKQYLTASNTAITKAGGYRQLSLKVDQLFGGEISDMNYSHVVLDIFPSPDALLTSHNEIKEERTASIQDMHSLLVEPSSSMLIATTKMLSSPIFRPFFYLIIRNHMDYSKTIDDVRENLVPTGIQPSSIQTFKDCLKINPDQSFTNILLTQRNPEVDAAELDRSVGLPSAMKLFGLGAHVQGAGKVVGTWINGGKIPDGVDEYALPLWPSRTVFQSYLTSVPKEVCEARAKGYTEAVQVHASEV